MFGKFSKHFVEVAGKKTGFLLHALAVSVAKLLTKANKGKHNDETNYHLAR